MKAVKSWENSKTNSKFNLEFNIEAINLVRQPGQSIPGVAKNLGISDSALRKWLRQDEIDGGRGPSNALTTTEKEELTELRRENRQLRMEKEILKKAAAFFAKEQM